MKTIALTTVALISAACAASPPVADRPAQSESLVEIRFAGERGSAGVGAFAFRDSTVYLGDAVVDDADITSVETRLRDGGLMMMLHLTDEGEADLVTATTERSGQTLALVVGGEARSVVTIQSPLGAGGVLGVGFATPDSTATRLNAAITERWPTPEAGHEH